VIAGVVFASHVAIHARFDQMGSDRFAEQEVIKPQAMILFIAISPVRPERIDTFITENITESVSPSVRKERGERLAWRRLNQGILRP